MADSHWYSGVHRTYRKHAPQQQQKLVDAFLAGLTGKRRTTLRLPPEVPNGEPNESTQSGTDSTGR